MTFNLRSRPANAPGKRRRSPLPLLSALCAATLLGICGPARADELRIMPLGDSITHGEGANGSLVPGGYRDPLAQELDAAGISFRFVGDQTDNATNYLTATGQTAHSGHGGWRIDQIQSNITNWQLTYTPDIVLLHIGTNDIIQNRSLGTGGYDTSNAIARLTTLLDTLYANNSSLIVVLSTLIPMADSRDGYVKNYNSLLESIVVPDFLNQGRSITLVDNYANFVTDTGEWRTDLYSGGNTVHPNAAGYQKMADTWFSAIQDIVTPPPPPPPISTSEVKAGAASMDGKIQTNLIRAGQPTLASVEVSHGTWSSAFNNAGLNDGSATATTNLAYYATKNPTHGSGSDNWLPVTITFTLAGSDTGYDITSVESLAGWKDSNLGDQKFQLLLSINGGEFLDYGTYGATGDLGDFASLVTVTDESGIIASGVTGVRFVYLTPDGTQAGDGGTVIRELQVFGVATVPEPSTFALAGIGLAGLILMRRKRAISA